MSHLHQYDGAAIRVTWDERRCIHFAACVRANPDVFQPGRRPWVQADAADADTVAAIVERCPTGALTYERLDGGPAEAPPDENLALVSRDGPVYLAGDLRLMGQYQVVEQRATRMALCRCGRSANKPYCDGSHARAGFADPAVARETVPEPEPSGTSPLKIDPVPHGPLVLRGRVRLCDSRGETVSVTDTLILCRCGASREKPFCDGSHTKVAGLGGTAPVEGVAPR